MKYRKRKVLAKNGSAEIILADYNLENNVLPVLIKTVLPNDLEFFYDRIRLAQSLNHPGIQQIVDFGTGGNQSNRKHYISCKHSEGITLTQLLQKMACCKKNLPLPLVIHIISSLCDTLEYLHHDNSAKFIPHGNICPDNVFITFSGEVLLIDTAIADLVTHRYDGTVLIPNNKNLFHHEDVINGKEWKKRHEIYSIGLMLLCTLIGYNHFMGFYNQNDTHKISSPSRFFPSIPADINRIIVRAIGNKPFGRYSKYSSIREFNNELISFASRTGIRFDKEITAITIYSLFSDSKEIPSQLRYLLQERAIDYCKRGNDNAIRVLLNHNLLDNKAFEPEEVLIELSNINYESHDATDKKQNLPKDFAVIQAEQILPPQLSIPYDDLHLPAPEGNHPVQQVPISINTHSHKTNLETTTHPIEPFSSIIINKTPALLRNLHIGNKDNSFTKTSQNKQDNIVNENMAQQQIAFSAIRLKSSRAEGKDEHPFSKLLLKEKTHT